MRLVIAKAFGVFSDGFDASGMKALIHGRDKGHITGHKEETAAEKMTGQHIHDGRLPVGSRTASRSYFVKVKADDLGISDVELRDFSQNRVHFDGIHKGTPDLMNGLFVIGVLDALILAYLHHDVGHQGDGETLCQQSFMDAPLLKKGIDHLPPCYVTRNPYPLIQQEFMKIRHGSGLIETRMQFRGELFIGKVNGSSEQTGNAVRRSMSVQRRCQQAEKVHQKSLVRRQRLMTAQRKVERIDRIVRCHAQAMISRQMLLFFRQIFFEKSYKPRT